MFRAIHDQIELVVNLEKALEMIERLPSQNRKAFNYEAQIAKLEERLSAIRSSSSGSMKTSRMDHRQVGIL